MSKLNGFIVFVVIILAGCASGIQSDRFGIQVVDDSAVSQCTYIDTVYGTSGWYGMFAERGFENARASVFEKAKTIGTTHLVWIPVSQGHGSSQAAGKAYRCINGK